MPQNSIQHVKSLFPEAAFRNVGLDGDELGNIAVVIRNRRNRLLDVVQFSSFALVNHPRFPDRIAKDRLPELFEEHGEQIESLYDALERPSQRQLSEYGVKVGSVEETNIFQAIKELMQRHPRAGFERVFARLKSVTGLDRVHERKENNVDRHAVLSAVALAAASLTAKRQGNRD